MRDDKYEKSEKILMFCLYVLAGSLCLFCGSVFALILIKIFSQ